jgi:hypothetical protein
MAVRSAKPEKGLTMDTDELRLRLRLSVLLEDICELLFAFEHEPVPERLVEQVKVLRMRIDHEIETLH